MGTQRYVVRTLTHDMYYSSDYSVHYKKILYCALQWLGTPVVQQQSAIINFACGHLTTAFRKTL